MFLKAQPVWASGMENEKNYELCFRSHLKKRKGMTLRVATSDEYQLFVDGNLAAFGPARTAKGYFKIDEIELTPFFQNEYAIVVLMVLSARINSYSLMDQSPFVSAEIICGRDCIIWTDTDGTFPAFHRPCRIQKVQRISYQRTFAEAYRLSSSDMLFFTHPNCSLSPCVLSLSQQKKYLIRDVRYPQYPYAAAKIIDCGNVNFDGICDAPYRDWSYTEIGPTLRGFSIDELDERMTDEVQGFSYQETQPPKTDKIVLSDSYSLYELQNNFTGFLQIEISCQVRCILYALFDELLVNNDVNCVRLGNCNCVKYYLQPGKYTLLTFQPYTMKYIKILVRGQAKVERVGLIQFKYQQPTYQVCIPQHDSALKKIAQAAVETFQQNTTDIFYDCPSRERAGWLCDSFFTARVEPVLSGECRVERAFLRNFLIADHFENQPNGMLPMCYPADHDDGGFIPNWAMWFVLELEEYSVRSGDKKLIREARSRVFELLAYLEQFENADGLLESLPGWIFVEWSDANKWGQDINFPTNMLYAKTLHSIANMYQQAHLEDKSLRLKTIIRNRSFNGTFFTDHEIKENGHIYNPGDISEVCQYYAFFTEVADKQEYPVLWQTLIDNFGPYRTPDIFPNVSPANAFIGDYLRLELLYIDGQHKKMLDDIRSYFLPMAERTGTLWEHNRPTASCCHGFASHVLYWLAKLYGTEHISG